MIDVLDDERRLIERLPTSYREAVWAIVARVEQRATARVSAAEERATCRFPEHRDFRGRVTHRRHLGSYGDGSGPMGDLELVACEVCGSVSVVPIVAVG